MHYLFFLLFVALAPHFIQANDVKICLVMMVKNDTQIVERNLYKVKEIVDCISICDIGAPELTKWSIEQFMRVNRIPGKIHSQEWINFGINRTLSVQAAQKTIEELGFDTHATYLLILDPDEGVAIHPEFIKNQLIDDAYLLPEKSLVLTSYFPHLLRASLPWESIGVAHEYWFCKEPYHSAKLETITIEEKKIAGREEIKLLTEALTNEPANKRYQFHLAQSYKQLKEYDDALKWYKSRIDGNGDKEEVWFSKYMIGECYEEMGQWEPALYWYLEAFQYNPDRAEPLAKVAKYYRLKGECDLAYLFAKHALRIPFSNEQMLFIAQSVYDYGLDEEISIAAFYTRFKDDGAVAADRIILKKNAPWYLKEQTYKNILFYVKNLENAEFRPVPVKLPPVYEGSNLTYNPMNPSILKKEDGYVFICRTVNFTLDNGNYATIDPRDNTIRTKNFLIHYDKEFNFLSQSEIVEKLARPKVSPPFPIEGLEDCRIVDFNQNYWFTCTTFDTNPYGPCQISLCRLAEESVGGTINVESLIPLKGPDPHRYEKNWLPFVHEGALCVVYSYDPFIVYRLNIKTGESEQIVHYEPKQDFSRFRGSAAPIPFDEGYLVLVHEVVMLANNSRCYLHRFLYLDENFMVTQVSTPFSFRHLGVEYCCSMTLDHSGGKLIMPIGIEDREAHLCIVDVNIVRSMLKAI